MFEVCDDDWPTPSESGAEAIFPSSEDGLAVECSSSSANMSKASEDGSTDADDTPVSVAHVAVTPLLALTKLSYPSEKVKIQRAELKSSVTKFPFLSFFL